MKNRASYAVFRWLTRYEKKRQLPDGILALAVSLCELFYAVGLKIGTPPIYYYANDNIC